MHSTGAAFTLLPSRRAISYLVNAHCYGREAMRNRPTLTSSDAQKMMAACKAEAAKHDFIVSIAIVDDGGYLLQLERADGAHLESPGIATLKARTAAVSRQSTQYWEQRVEERKGFLALSGFIPLQGGIPLLHQGQCVGGIGVSGVTSPQCEQIARAGAAVLG
jgi:glc operon protein GlcG